MVIMMILMWMWWSQWFCADQCHASRDWCDSCDIWCVRRLAKHSDTESWEIGFEKSLPKNQVEFGGIGWQISQYRYILYLFWNWDCVVVKIYTINHVLPTFSVPSWQVCENSVNICHHELTSIPFDNITSQVLSCWRYWTPPSFQNQTASLKMVLLSKSVHFGDILLEQYEVEKCMIDKGISSMGLNERL